MALQRGRPEIYTD